MSDTVLAVVVPITIICVYRLVEKAIDVLDLRLNGPKKD
jgi:hypothetical protein